MSVPLAPSSIDPDHIVRTYMGDHLTVMRAGRALAGRMLRGDGHGGSQERAVRAAAETLDEGARALGGLLRQLGASPPRTKLLAAAVAERLGRTKLNGRLTGRSPLTEVLELEALEATLALTAAGWRGLQCSGLVAEAVATEQAARTEQARSDIGDRARAAAARVLARGAEAA